MWCQKRFSVWRSCKAISSMIEWNVLLHTFGFMWWFHYLYGMTRSSNNIFGFVLSRLQGRFLVMISVLFVNVVYIIMMNELLMIQKSMSTFCNVFGFEKNLKPFVIEAFGNVIFAWTLIPHYYLIKCKISLHKPFNCELYDFNAKSRKDQTLL